MDKYTATEISYKNGYNQALKEFAERVKQNALIDNGYEVLQQGTIDQIAKELERK